MEELSWERNMSTFPWSNINHHQQPTEETIIFGSENTFLNPIQYLPNTGSTTTSSPINVAAASSFGSASDQYWRQTLAPNGIHEGKNVIPTTATATATDTSLEERISVIFSDYNNLCNKIINNVSGVSSDGSVTKDIDDVTVSQCSPEKKPNHCRRFCEENRPKSKRPRSDPVGFTSSTINFRQSAESDETDSEVIAQMKEMIYRAAAFRPVSFADEEVEKPKRRNVRISSDPQTVAARKRRERVSERIRVLQKLVPGGEQMDTASMLNEAANYLKFLRSQVKALEQFGKNLDCGSFGTTTNAHGTTGRVQNVNDYVTLGVPFRMQGHFLLPHQQIYHTPPHE